ncbi:MAG: cytochrome c-type biogenesis protein [Caulobacterales bacterium]
MNWLAAFAAAAVTSVMPLADPAEEARARNLDAEIRCVQCENEPISQSTADIAADMRRLVRERVEAGDSDEEIRTYFRARYGDFVLLRPPVDARTLALWGAPLLILLIGGGAAFAAMRRRNGDPLPEPEESER